MTSPRALFKGPTLAPWWAKRTGRERLLIIGGAALLGVYLLTTTVARPLLASRTDALLAIGRQDAALAQLAALGDGAQPTIPTSTGRPVTAIATDTAPDFGLTISRIEPEGDGASLVVEDAGFAEIILWIEALERDHALRVAAIEMDRRPEPGVVSARLTVTR